MKITLSCSHACCLLTNKRLKLQKNFSVSTVDELLGSVALLLLTSESVYSLVISLLLAVLWSSFTNSEALRFLLFVLIDCLVILVAFSAF